MRAWQSIPGWVVLLLSMASAVWIIAVLGGTYLGVVAPFAYFSILFAGVIPLSASLMAARNYGVAARLYLCCAALAPVFIIFLSPEFGGLLPATVVFSFVSVFPYLFCRIADRRTWPVLLGDPIWLRRRWFLAASGAGLFCVLFAGALVLTMFLPWWPAIGDCGQRPLFGRTELGRTGEPLSTDFIAKISMVGPRTYAGKSLWAIAHIEKRYSGPSRWFPDTFILRERLGPGDLLGDYFVEGQQSQSALGRFLPTIEAVSCGRTGPRQYAVVAERILQDGPPRSGARLIGRVHRAGTSAGVAGAEVAVEGSGRSIRLRTDADGVYDVVGLAPGAYVTKLLSSAHTVPPAQDFNLNEGEIGEGGFYE
jgi:hypothetical protein